MKKFALLITLIAAAAGILTLACKKEQPRDPYGTPEDTFVTFWEAAKAEDAEGVVNCFYLSKEENRAAVEEAYQNKMDLGVYSNIKNYRIFETQYDEAKTAATIVYQLVSTDGSIGEKQSMKFVKSGDRWLIYAGK